MTDWIDDFEKKAKGAANIQKQLRLHDSQIIQGKAPTFWSATVAWVKHYCGKLSEKFPDEPRYRCEIIRKSTGGLRFFAGGTLPHKGIDAELNLDGQCIVIQEGFRQSRNEAAVEDGSPYQVEITVGEQEQLMVSFKGKLHESSESLAEHFVRFVCDIP
jgi:hypothetical protein